MSPKKKKKNKQEEGCITEDGLGSNQRK